MRCAKHVSKFVGHHPLVGLGIATALGTTYIGSALDGETGVLGIAFAMGNPHAHIVAAFTDSIVDIVRAVADFWELFGPIKVVDMLCHH